MQDSSIRSFNLAGSVDASESVVAANPPPRLIASAGGTPMRVLCTAGTGAGIISVAFDQAQLRNLDPIGLVPGGDVFTPVGDIFTNRSEVFIIAPGQKLYAVTLNGDQTINVATSDSIEIAQVLAQAKRASGVASRLFVVNFEIDPLTGQSVRRIQNNPPLLATAPDWSPMRVTVFLPAAAGPVSRRLSVSDDSDLLRQGSAGNPFRMTSNGAGPVDTQVTFVLAPNQTLYGIASADVGESNVPVFVSTTLFTDVFNPNVLRSMPDNQMRALWNNLWQGSDGVCF